MEGPVNIIQKYRIGELDQRVQILAPTESQNGNGETIQTWGEYATRYASVTPLGGSEAAMTDSIIPVSRCRFVFRYDNTITEKYRLVWNSHTYDIRSIDVVPRNRFLVIIAESDSLSGSAAVDYGNYYATNSLKVRMVTKTIAGVTPTAAETTAAVGLTPAAAGAGYLFLYAFTHETTTNYLATMSNGTSWVFADGTILT